MLGHLWQQQRLPRAASVDAERFVFSPRWLGGRVVQRLAPATNTVRTGCLGLRSSLGHAVLSTKQRPSYQTSSIPTSFAHHPHTNISPRSPSPIVKSHRGRCTFPSKKQQDGFRWDMCVYPCTLSRDHSAIASAMMSAMRAKWFRKLCEWLIEQLVEWKRRPDHVTLCLQFSKV